MATANDPDYFIANSPVIQELEQKALQALSGAEAAASRSGAPSEAADGDLSPLDVAAQDAARAASQAADQLNKTVREQHDRLASLIGDRLDLAEQLSLLSLRVHNLGFKISKIDVPAIKRELEQKLHGVVSVVTAVEDDLELHDGIENLVCMCMYACSAIEADCIM